MTMLINLKFIHYSPKDSEDGIKEFIVTDSLQSAIKYIDKKHLYGALKDYEEDEECEFFPDVDWVKKNKHRKQEAKDMGISIDEYNHHTGSSKALTLFLNGTFWKEVSDAYYGVTHYDWSEFKDVTEDEIATLSKFFPVKDIRKK